MEFFTAYQQDLDVVRQLIGAVSEREALPDVVDELSDADVVVFTKTAAALERAAATLRLAGTGVITRRSGRDIGHAGLAQAQGFRNSVAFVQQITGTSRAQAAREVRVSESLLETSPGSLAGRGRNENSEGPGANQLGIDPMGAGSEGSDIEQPAEAWHAPLDRAVLNGTLNYDQHDAIRTGLGEPPEPTTADLAAARAGMSGAPQNPETPEMPETPETPEVGQANEGAAADAADAAAIAVAKAVIVEAWNIAAVQLIDEAQYRTLEELRKAARCVRDTLDPEGSERRFTERYEARSFRMWVDARGAHHGAFTFDDESAAWLKSIIDAGMRPRRGGPRFVDAEEKAQAKELTDDPRTNLQLTHDLIMDVLRSGTLATATDVMGARQVGVRLVQVVADAQPAHSFLESDGTPIPGASIDRSICDTGIVPVAVDPRGNPLDVGREQRLFTSKQRIGLALRDGGCRWTDCDRPASYCEAHHIDEWVADQGRTDIDKGILLCRFHHGQLHSNGWKITRDELGPFVLHSPTGEANGLPVRAARAYAWGAPPKLSVRFHPGQCLPPQPVPPEAWGLRRSAARATQGSQPEEGIILPRPGPDPGAGPGTIVSAGSRANAGSVAGSASETGGLSATAAAATPGSVATARSVGSAGPAGMAIPGRKTEHEGTAEPAGRAVRVPAGRPNSSLLRQTALDLSEPSLEAQKAKICPAQSFQGTDPLTNLLANQTTAQPEESATALPVAPPVAPPKAPPMSPRRGEPSGSLSDDASSNASSNASSTASGSDDVSSNASASDGGSGNDGASASSTASSTDSASDSGNLRGNGNLSGEPRRTTKPEMSQTLFGMTDWF